jgi:hypothetical protein
MALMSFFRIIIVSCIMAFSFAIFTDAKASEKQTTKSKATASAKRKSSSSPIAFSNEPSPLTQGIDSIFLQAKSELNKIVESPILRGKSLPLINSFFFKVLKEHQPYYSLMRVNERGDVVNEVIRLVEKDEIKKQNVYKEAWFKSAGLKHKDYNGIIKLEETGRYYLLWATPVCDTAQNGKVTIRGVVVLKIDLWDCFHKFANSIETPFLVRIERLHLYSNKWKDTISYKEKALCIPGVKNAFVRYPKDITAPAPSAAQVSVPPVNPASVSIVDSNQIKAMQDSLKKATAQMTKKKNFTRNLVIAVIIVLMIIGAILLLVVIPILRQRSIMANIDRDQG